MYQVDRIGQVIARRRRELNMTQEQLATMLHITPQAISKWESGVGLPDLTLLPQISKALSLSPNELMGGDIDAEQRSAPEQVEEKSEINTPADVYSEVFAGIHSIHITGNLPCELDLRKANDGKTRLEATGDQRFLSALQAKSDGNGTLQIHLLQIDSPNNMSHPNRITIFCGFSSGKELKLALCSFTVNIEPAFGRVSYSPEGSNSATIRLGKVTERLQVTGAEFLKLSCSEAANLSIHSSNGAIDISCGKVLGSAEFSGCNCSARVSLGSGTLDALKVAVSGDLQFSANEVTVAGNAALQADGDGFITVGCIKGIFNTYLQGGICLNVLRNEIA